MHRAHAPKNLGVALIGQDICYLLALSRRVQIPRNGRQKERGKWK